MNDETKHEMKVFSNPLFGDVRTFVIDNIPWFVAVDVCDALDIGNSRQAVTRLDEDEKNTVIINESGLYALILTSRKEEAKQFKRWITHEVIPSIRKHGLYMTNSMLEQVSKNPELITAMAKQLLEEVDTKAVDIFQPASSLSGGNQQKVVVAKALSQEMKVVIMDEPTKGVDVGAKAEIYAIMGDLAKKGYAIVLISSEMPEILGMADRIVVMCNGRKTGELNQEEATQERILELAMEKGTSSKEAGK